jgi:hypothetical protein
MKTVFITTLLLASAVLADHTTLIALDGALGAGVPAVVERFLDEDAVIQAIFLRPSAGSVALTADLYLDGGALAAPMVHGSAFRATANSAHPALIEGKFVLPRPDTEKPAVQLVRIQTAVEGSVSSLVGAFRLRWVSQKECKIVLERALMKNSLEQSARLIVFGALPGLRELLQAWRISFEDAGKEPPLRVEAGSAVIGEDLPGQDTAPVLAPDSSLLLIRLRPAASVEIWRKDSGATRLTIVTLPHAGDWRKSPCLIRLLTEHLTHTAP